jgi:hypothetical protein
MVEMTMAGSQLLCEKKGERLTERTRRDVPFESRSRRNSTRRNSKKEEKKNGKKLTA